MNKMVKFAGIMAALAATLLLGGCNEEKKYNALKMEVVPEIEEALKISGHSIPLGNREAYISDLENTVLEIEGKEKNVFSKLNQMKELSKDDVNLSNDYLKVKREADKITNHKLSYAEALEKAKRSYKSK